MTYKRFQPLSATFIAIALCAGCTVSTGEYPDEALGSYVAGLDEASHLSAEQIQTAVRAEFPQYKGCYEGLLAADSTAAGRISLKLTINPDGFLAETAVGSAEGELTDGDFQQCMLSATETLVFPVAAQQTDVVYPILMTPGDES